MATKDPEIMKRSVQKRKETLIEKHGVPYAPMDAKTKEEFNRKRIQTNIRKYGFPHHLQNETIRNKQKVTNLERYGVTCTLQQPRVKRSIEQKYGVTNVSYLKEIQNKISKKNKETFKSGSPIWDSIKKTNLEKYGVEHAAQSINIQQKMKNTNMERYGVENHAIITSAWYQHKDRMLELHEKGLSDAAIGRELGINPNTISRWLRKANIRPGTITSPEYQIISLLESKFTALYFKIHDRQTIKPKEIDILIPSLKLGIEVNGKYWHEDYPLGHKYHKWKMAKEVGIDLLHLDCETILSSEVLSVLEDIFEQSM